MKLITLDGNLIAHHEQSGSILDSIEKSDIKIESQCRNGFCGACRCRLLHGKVRYTKEVLAYVEPGDILPCCTVPLTDISLSSDKS